MIILFECQVCKSQFYSTVFIKTNGKCPKCNSERHQHLNEIEYTPEGLRWEDFPKMTDGEFNKLCADMRKRKATKEVLSGDAMDKITENHVKGEPKGDTE